MKFLTLGIETSAFQSVQRCNFIINPLKTGNPKTGTLATSEDPDEMLHNVS